MLLELIAQRGKQVLARLGIEQLDGARENIDILVRLTRLTAAALVHLDDEHGGMYRLDSAHALDDARAAHVGAHFNALADHARQLLVDILDVIDFQLFH